MSPKHFDIVQFVLGLLLPLVGFSTVPMPGTYLANVAKSISGFCKIRDAVELIE